MGALIIAEKPSLGRAIADAIPGPATGRGPIYKGEYVITWLFGHVLTLMEPEDYDPRYKKWDLNDLPIYFDNWGHKVSKDKQAKLEELKKLFADADCVIHAGDPDDEGQYLVDEVIRWFNYRGPVKRMETANMVQEALEKALRNLTDNGPREKDGWAAHARAISDLVVGVNLSRYFTMTNNSGLITVGRVQTPTLGLVVNRDLLIENHQKIPYYTVGGNILIDGKTIRYDIQLEKDDPRTDNGKIQNRAEAEAICKELRGKKLSGITISHKNSKEQPPLPFDLVSLQTYCGKKFQYDPQQVMDYTQALREQFKCITYNRSECRYLSSEEYNQSPSVVGQVVQNIGFTPRLLDLSIRSKAFDDKKIEGQGHYAIIPTCVSVTKEQIAAKNKAYLDVYLAICKYYLAQFLPPAVKDKTELRKELKGIGELNSFSTVIVEPGYRTIFSELEPEEPTLLSQLASGVYDGEILTAEVTERTTNPPTRYTKSSLNEDMTKISKYCTDPQVRELLLQKDKDKDENGSIGTPATRASIIDGLVKRGYLEEDSKKRLVSTQKGRELCRILPQELTQPNMTAYWWLVQEQIKAGEVDYTALPLSVLDSVKNIMSQQYDRMDVSDTGSGSASKKSSSVQKERKIIGICPRCGNAIIEGKKGFGCSNFKNGCTFTIWKTRKSGIFKDIRITGDMAKSLLAGEILMSDKLYSSNKKANFTGKFKLTDRGPKTEENEGGVVLELVIEDYNREDRVPVGTCPRCKKPVYETASGYACSGKDDGCKFVIWKSRKSGPFQKMVIGPNMARHLLGGGIVTTSSLFSSTKNKKYKGSFYLADKGSDYGADFQFMKAGKYAVCFKE